MLQAKTEESLDSYLGGVASRLRHDLKGGLITLRMGLEALSDDEDLKPLLLERAQFLEGLADKLTLLLRMGQITLEPVRLSALLSEFRTQANARFPDLEVLLPDNLTGLKPEIDGEALIFALLELAENAQIAGATRLELQVRPAAESWVLEIRDNGQGLSESDDQSTKRLATLGHSGWGRSGLGLSVAQRCALGHGGDLSILSCPAGGTTVKIELAQGAS